MAYEVVEDVNIDDLVERLTARNTPECYQAAFVINALRGKKTVVSAPEPEPRTVPGELVAETPAPATVAEAEAAQQP